MPRSELRGIANRNAAIWAEAAAKNGPLDLMRDGKDLEIHRVMSRLGLRNNPYSPTA